MKPAAGPLNEAKLVFATVDFAAIDTVRVDGNVLNGRDCGRIIALCPTVELL